VSQTEVIAAEGLAKKAAAADRIAAQARVEVAELGTREASEQAKALLIEAEAAKSAAALAAEGVYAEIFQKAKAMADGKMADAEAQNALNQAINQLTPEAQAHLVDLARITMTPEAIRESMKAVEKIQGINITSMDGMAGAFGGGAQGGGVDGGAGGNGGNNPMAQLVNAIMMLKMSEPLLDKVIAGVNGDKGIAKNMPGAPTVVFDTEAAPVAQVVVPEQNNQPPQQGGRKKPSAGMQPG
jgi:uncharacterized membrane protein YqiK